MFAPTEHKARRLPAKPPPPELIALGHQPVARRPSPSTVACPGRSALGVQLCSGDPLRRPGADPVRVALQRGLHRAQPASPANQPSANTCSTRGCCVVLGAASVEPGEPLDELRPWGCRRCRGCPRSAKVDATAQAEAESHRAGSYALGLHAQRLWAAAAKSAQRRVWRPTARRYRRGGGTAGKWGVGSAAGRRV